MRKHVQNGSALIISLVFLLILTMIGIASIQDSTLQERMAGNERDRNLAFQTAEAALRVGEDHLRQAGIVFFRFRHQWVDEPQTIPVFGLLRTPIRGLIDPNRFPTVMPACKALLDIPSNGSRPRPSHRVMRVRFPSSIPTGLRLARRAVRVMPW